MREQKKSKRSHKLILDTLAVDIKLQMADPKKIEIMSGIFRGCAAGSGGSPEEKVMDPNFRWK